MMSWPILSVVTFLPLLGALFIALLVRGNERRARGTARWVALWTTLVTFAISLVMVWRFDPARRNSSSSRSMPWLGVAILSHGRRRHFAAVRDPDHRADADLHPGELDRRSRSA